MNCILFPIKIKIQLWTKFIIYNSILKIIAYFFLSNSLVYNNSNSGSILNRKPISGRIALQCIVKSQRKMIPFVKYFTGFNGPYS